MFRKVLPSPPGGDWPLRADGAPRLRPPAYAAKALERIAFFLSLDYPACADLILSLRGELTMAVVEKYERYSATLRIFGKIEDISVIGMRLGLEPTRVRRRGEPVEGTSERYELDSWEMTAPVTKDRPLEAHLAWLKSRLLPRSEEHT